MSQNSSGRSRRSGRPVPIRVPRGRGLPPFSPVSPARRRERFSEAQRRRRARGGPSRSGRCLCTPRGGPVRPRPVGAAPPAADPQGRPKLRDLGKGTFAAARATDASWRGRSGAPLRSESDPRVGTGRGTAFCAPPELRRSSPTSRARLRTTTPVRTSLQSTTRDH